MCGRYTLFVDRNELEERFDARFEGRFAPTYNAAPGRRLPVITDADAGRIRRLEWGLVPSWADDDANPRINARAETVAEKPTFRGAYRRAARPGERRDGDRGRVRGRCLVLADGFYEWVDDGGGKRPYRVAFEDDRPFAMAGLWERWTPETSQARLDAFGAGDADGDRIRETFAVVTTEPNDLVADLHDRMAAILDPDDERRWLEADDPREVLGPRPADGMRAYPVSRAVGDPTNDEPSLVDPVED